MLIKTILNKCHKLKSFVYENVKLGTYLDKEVIEVEILPRRNSKAICSVCKRPGSTYDTSRAYRRFEFISLSIEYRDIKIEIKQN